MTTTTATLTEHNLRAAGACPEGLAFYRATWPDHRTTPPTWATVCAALSDPIACPSGLEWWGWLVSCGLPPADLTAEYQRVRAAALAEYERVDAPAWAEYQRVSAAAWAEYQRVRDPAWAEYQRVVRAWLVTAGGR